MPLFDVSLENLHKVKGGLVALMLQRALDRVALDIASAPDLPDWRQVTLKIKAKPVLEQLELDHVAVEFEVGMRNPTRVTSSNMLIREKDKQQRLVFNLDSEEDPHQRSIHDEIDKRAQERKDNAE